MDCISYLSVIELVQCPRYCTCGRGIYCCDESSYLFPSMCATYLLGSLSLSLSSPVFEEPEDPSSRSFFSEIIASISDVKFSHSGRYILSRDYLTVKVSCGIIS